MRNPTRCSLAAVAALTLTLIGCTDGDLPTNLDPDPDEIVELTVTGFPVFGQSEGIFELWVSFALTRAGSVGSGSPRADEAPGPGARHSAAASAGRFKVNETLQIVDEDYQPMVFTLDPESDDVPTNSNGDILWQLAVDAFITIELREDPDPDDPNVPAIIAGAFLNGAAGLSIAHDDAVGSGGLDYAAGSGSFHLATPTTMSTTDELQGVWFAAPGGASASLDLPLPPRGWVYEAWVSLLSLDSASLGRFTNVTGADFDGAGSTTGTLPGYAFPGSDFPFSGQSLDLTDGAVFITLEPNGDQDGDGPFFLEILGANIPSTAGTVQDMTNVADFPTATVVIPFDP